MVSILTYNTLKKKPFWRGSYKGRFAGYSYLVSAKFSGGIIASDVFAVAEQSVFDKAVNVATGALVYMAFPAPLDLAYLLTFIAIGGTIYEWELEERSTKIMETM